MMNRDRSSAETQKERMVAAPVRCLTLWPDNLRGPLVNP